MGNHVEFAKDLYRGSAAYYDKYRFPYPTDLINDLIARTAPTGHGRLLDLACGTGQLAFPLAGAFAEVWALDQEPDMVDMVRAKATAAGPALAQRFRPFAASAEEANLPERSFELVVIGNAFHRLRREVVATRVRKWLQPGGHLALCWSFLPWTGSQEWERAFNDLLERWKARLSGNRVPSRWDQAQRELPDAELLTDFGFEMIGHYEFAVEHRWTVPDLAGLIRSTSFLPASVLGPRGFEFDEELAATLGPYTTNGQLAETVSFAYELARTRA